MHIPKPSQIYVGKSSVHRQASQRLDLAKRLESEPRYDAPPLNSRDEDEPRNLMR